MGQNRKKMKLTIVLIAGVLSHPTGYKDRKKTTPILTTTTIVPETTTNSETPVILPITEETTISNDETPVVLPITEDPDLIIVPMERKRRSILSFLQQLNDLKNEVQDIDWGSIINWTK